MGCGCKGNKTTVVVPPAPKTNVTPKPGVTTVTKK